MTVRGSWLPLLTAWGGALLLIAVAQLCASVFDRSLRFFTNEPQRALEGPWYAGAASNVGALGWLTGCVACALAWWVLDARKPDAFASPFLHAAALLGLLGADDLFLLHDELYNHFVPEEVVGGIYFLLIAAYGIVHAAFLREEDRLPLLWIAFGFLLVSAFFDLVEKLQIVEDATKYLGIATIVLLFVRAAARRLRAAVG